MTGFKVSYDAPGVRPDKAGEGTIVLLDELPLRRAAYHSLLDSWAATHALDLREEDFESYRPGMNRETLLIISGGSTSIGELRLRIAPLAIDMGAAPLVIISDSDEPGEIVDAIALGARAYLPTGLSADLVRNILTFVLAGGDFFPASVLSARGQV